MSTLLSCANKREILDRVKEVLEPHVQSGVIDREDFKGLAKKSAEAVAPPVAAERVERVTLRLLVAFLGESGAEEATIAPIREALEAGAAAERKDDDGQQERQAEQQQPAAPNAGFSLSAFQARMTKKREELRRHRETTSATAGETAAATASSAPSESSADAKCGDQAADDEPPARRHKTESRTPPPPPPDVDLYADLLDNAGSGGWRPSRQPTPM